MIFPNISNIYKTTQGDIRIMPVPAEYERASTHFYRFLEDARDISELTTTNQAYTMVQGVFQTFRRRLTFQEAILFANALPPLLSALFITDWNTEEPKKNFESREALTQEVKVLRADHNFSPDSAISSVAKALRENMDEQVLDEVLEKLPEGATEFWQV